MRSGSPVELGASGPWWLSLVEAVRRRRSPPEERLKEAGVERGMTVADVGAGYGFFAFPAAAIVGAGGLVYAVEPDPKRAGEMEERARANGTHNLVVLVRNAEDVPEIGKGSVDVAISMSSFHHFADSGKALAELRRIVKPGGLVYIWDVKAGRVFKHGSELGEFRAAVCRWFPNAEIEEGRGRLVARIPM